MFFGLLRDFVLLTSAAFLVDWCGFGSLKSTARSFRPLTDDFTYRSTLVPRTLVFPLAAALCAFGKQSETYSILAGLAGLGLWAIAHGSLWLGVMRQRLRNEP